MLAENCLAEWSNLLTSAAIKGSIALPDEDGELHEYALTKNQTKLIEVRVHEAQKHLDYVNEIALFSYKSEDGLKKDSRGLSWVAAGNSGFHRLVPVTSGSFSACL